MSFAPRFLCVSLCCFAAGSVAASAADWPRFRGPDGAGIAADAKSLPDRWSASENLLWKAELPGAGSSSPIILNQRIYLTCYSGYAVPGQDGGDLDQLKRHIMCLRLDDGRLIWQKELPARQPEQARVRDHGYAANTPIADADRVYAFLGTSGVIAFDHDGNQLWHADVGDRTHGWGSAASPMLYKDTLIINASVESESLIALDRRTGKELWRAPGIKESWNTPILVDVAGKTELVVAIMGSILGFDPDSGRPLWSCKTDIGWYMVPSLVAADGVIYCIGGRSGGALAVRAGGRGEVTASHRLWTGRKGSNVSSPILHEGRLYWMHENLGIACCADAKTGQMVYEQRLERAGQFYASTVLADGKLYCVSRNGGAFVLAAGPEFRLIAHNTLGDRSTFDATPAVAGSRILLRSNRFLYCIGKQ